MPIIFEGECVTWLSIHAYISLQDGTSPGSNLLNAVEVLVSGVYICKLHQCEKIFIALLYFPLPIS